MPAAILDCAVPKAADSGGIGEFWQPTAERHVRDYQDLDWSPERPAPEGIVFDLIFLGFKSREPKVGLRGLRAVARYAGWGKTRAKRVLDEATAAWRRWTGTEADAAQDTCEPGAGHPDPDVCDLFGEVQDTCGTAAIPVRDSAFSSLRARDNSQQPNIQHNSPSGDAPPTPPLIPSPEAGTGDRGTPPRGRKRPEPAAPPPAAAPLPTPPQAAREGAPLADLPALSPPAAPLRPVPGEGAEAVPVALGLPPVLAEPLAAQGLGTLGEVAGQTRGQLAREQLWPRGTVPQRLNELETALAGWGLALLTTEALRARLWERQEAAAAGGSRVPARRPAPQHDDDPFLTWTGESLGLDQQYAHLPFQHGRHKKEVTHGQ